MEKDRAAAALAAAGEIVVEDEDQVVEIVVAPHAIATVGGGQADGAIVAAARRVFAPALIAPHRAQRHAAGPRRRRSAVIAPQQPEPPGRRRAIALALVAHDSRRSQRARKRSGPATSQPRARSPARGSTRKVFSRSDSPDMAARVKRAYEGASDVSLPAGKGKRRPGGHARLFRFVMSQHDLIAAGCARPRRRALSARRLLLRAQRRARQMAGGRLRRRPDGDAALDRRRHRAGADDRLAGRRPVRLQPMAAAGGCASSSWRRTRSRSISRRASCRSPT